jgi:hypothetical protein
MGRNEMRTRTRLLAEAMLDEATLKDIALKKMATLAAEQ